MIKSISELKDSLKGEDVFVVGSGASIDYYGASFFKGKKLIDMNDNYKGLVQ